ncbi:uncharacterized protein LOC112521554 [Cynara cardunculus var. scolymus]|uniref:DUF4378 domain-containing protein n=1 Tax=Cynara cardunculus var. scolymus TaxID=59895 RepID=A0A103XG27_CYNCS|nr:uncharacterized protein LOC112521554 [Cynara cardunculus var. scolymus]XP_024986246.1 uncharacterized protein LOC112521554 [Cynara cardunculus var. scolymus]KVH90095.1 hypothetical protein Ccrd_007895 [Cynara cardunculus var. scolymus]
MARKSPKCPPTVEPNQFGCVWNFSDVFDHRHHHHGRPHRKMLSDESHGSKGVPGAEHTRNLVRVLTFDEQLRNINIESKKKTASVKQSLKGETSSSDHTNKNNEVWKNTMDKSFWKRIKSRYENPNKKKENPSIVDRIVVLKPSQHVVECPVDVGCRCSYLQTHNRSTSKQQIVKHTQVSFNDVRKNLKYAKKLKSIRKTRSCEAFEGGEIDGSASKMEKVSLVPFSKQGEPEIFMEARRHLAERLRQVAMGESKPSTSSSKRGSRTLERILLSSPIHESMATFGRKSEEIFSLQTRKEKTWTGSSSLNQIEDSSATGFFEIMDADDLLRGVTKFSNKDSVPNNAGVMGRDGCIKRSLLEFSLDVSSPKADCKSQNMDHDQFRENPSPVSVLESFFTDNVSSPTSTVESVELQIQPHRLDFEEHSSQTSSPPYQKTSLSSFMEDRGFISSYVNAIYQTSQSNWEDFLVTDYPSESSCDHKLLHDCVKEVLIASYSPWMTLFNSKVRPFSLEKDVVDEVIEQVGWHTSQPMVPRTLDNLVRRDITKCGQWVDVISHRNDIVFEVVDETLQVLIMEAISDIHA